MKQEQRNLLVIAKESKALSGLKERLVKNGFDCSVTPYGERLIDQVSKQRPDAVIIEINGYVPANEIQQFIGRIKEDITLPVIALVATETLDDIFSSPYIDDFLASPYNSEELALRLKRLLGNTRFTEGEEIIRCNGLKIDLARCEVTLGGGQIELTYKEYELLKYLASNPGRVYTREMLLDKVWGLDYYGGDRTVDVHIRRLRSKIENPDNEYIETVRNIGYRFKKVS